MCVGGVVDQSRRQFTQIPPASTTLQKIPPDPNSLKSDPTSLNHLKKDPTRSQQAQPPHLQLLESLVSCQNTFLGQNWSLCSLVSSLRFSSRKTNANFASHYEHLDVQHGSDEEKDASVEGMMKMMTMMMMRKRMMRGRKRMMMMMTRNP